MGYFLIIMMGFSPGGRSGTAMETVQYWHPNLKSCEKELVRLEQYHEKIWSRFIIAGICVKKNRTE